METNERWKNEVGSPTRSPQEKLNTICYSAEDLKKLFEVGGVTEDQLVDWINASSNLIRYMFLAGYTKNEICQRLGIPTVKIGKKERLLYERLLDGYIEPTDSLNIITVKMNKYYKVSRQSWAIAIKKLEELGLVR